MDKGREGEGWNWPIEMPNGNLLYKKIWAGARFKKGEGRNLLKLQLLSELQMTAWARSGKLKAGCAHTVKKRLGFVKRKGRSTILVEQKIGYGRCPGMKKVWKV